MTSTGRAVGKKVRVKGQWGERGSLEGTSSPRLNPFVRSCPREGKKELNTPGRTEDNTVSSVPDILELSSSVKLYRTKEKEGKRR